jgi:hypothetical protein
MTISPWFAEAKRPLGDATFRQALHSCIQRSTSARQHCSLGVTPLAALRRHVPSAANCRSPPKLARTNAEGAEDHGEAMARTLFQQRSCDWGDEVLEASSRP